MALRKNQLSNIKNINKRKPQTNNKIERKHQMIGNMTQTQQVESEDINKNDPWSDILTAMMFATQANLP